MDDSMEAKATAKPKRFCTFAPQHDGLAGRKPEKVPVASPIFSEIAALEVQRIAQCNRALAGTFIAGIVGQHHMLDKISGHVGQSDFNRVDNDKAALSLRIQLLTAALLKHVDRSPHLATTPRHTNHIAERVQCLGRVAAAPKTV